MKTLIAIALGLLASAVSAQMLPTPARDTALAAGPYETLVIRGATIITGNGGPPYGPADIIISGGKITDIRSAGTPGLPMKTGRAPANPTHEIDATGMYVLPGFVDMHGHNGDPEKMNDPSYAWRLWLAHGVTTVRGVSFFGGDVARAFDERKRAAAGEIISPRLYVYQTLGSGANAGWKGGRVLTPEKAREWVRWAASVGIDGIKFFNRGDETPEIDRAAIAEAKKTGAGHGGPPVPKQHCGVQRS